MLQHKLNSNTKKMDDLDDPFALSLKSLMNLMSYDLTFRNSAVSCIRARASGHARASAPVSMCDLVKKSKNYFRARDMSFGNHMIL